MEHTHILWCNDSFAWINDSEELSIYTPIPRDEIETRLIESIQSVRYQYFVDLDPAAYATKLVDCISRASLQDTSNDKMRQCYLISSWINAMKIQEKVDSGLLHWVRDSISIHTETLSFAPKVQALLRHVNTQAILDEVRRHQEYEPRSEFFSKLEQILNPKNRVRGESDLSDREFSRNFESRKFEAAKLRESLRDVHQDFALLLEICSGNEQSISSICQSWYEELLLTIVFVDGQVGDIRRLVQKICAKYPNMTLFEKLLSHLLMEDSLSLALLGIWEGFPLWFSSHVLDVLSSNDKLTHQDQLDLAEQALEQYIDSMVFDSRISFEAVSNYILVHYETSEGAINLLERVATSRLEQIEAIKEYCAMNQIEQVTQSVLKITAARALEQGDTINAITFGASSKDKSTRNRVESQLVQEALSGSTTVYDKVRRLPFEVRNQSAVCRFLIIYSDFKSLITQNEILKAAELLKQFFVKKAAPKEFWGQIFTDATVIFDSNEIVFNYDDMMEILNWFDSIKNPNYGRVEMGKQEIMNISSTLKKALRFTLEY